MIHGSMFSVSISVWRLRNSAQSVSFTPTCTFFETGLVTDLFTPRLIHHSFTHSRICKTHARTRSVHSHSKSKPSKSVAEDLSSSASKARTTTASTTNTAKTATISKATRVENLYGSDVIDVLPLPLPSASSAVALSVCQSAPVQPQILAPSPPPSPLSHGPISHLDGAPEHEAFRVHVPPGNVVPRYDRVDVDVDVADAGTSTSTLTAMGTTTGTGTNRTKVTFVTRRSRSPQYDHNQVVVSPMRRGMKRPSMNVDAGEVVDWNPDPVRVDLAPQEDHGCDYDRYDGDDGYGHSHGRSPQGNARPLKKSRCAGGSDRKSVV